MSNLGCAINLNNNYSKFPALMSDGRQFCDWKSGALSNKLLIDSENIKSNTEYREFLIKNADTIIKMNQYSSCEDCCNCPPIYENVQESAAISSPFLYASCLDDSRPSGYETSDMKEVYLSSTELNNRLNTPTITQEDLIKMGYANYN